jgi:tRNA threonylcarbamoyladenosine biosynthesis protein TsaB
MDPLILALDASHMTGSVAVTRGSETVHEIIFDASDTHSATLMPAVDRCLEAAGASIADMDLFVTVIGPGSFTGLRIGLATVKGFAALRRRPVAAVGTLEMAAAASRAEGGYAVPLIDARRGEVYSAMYDVSGELPAARIDPFACAPRALAGRIAGAGLAGEIFVCGSGLDGCRAELEETFPAGTLFASPGTPRPPASVAAALALARDAVPYEELAGLEPLYVRPPDAKLPSTARLRPGGGR